MLKKIFMFIGVIAVISVIGSAMGSDGGTSTDDDSTYADQAVQEMDEAADEQPAANAASTKEAKPEPKYTSGQANAIAKAQDYLDYSAFSKKGLIYQLKFDDFNAKQATFAVNHIKVDWNAQAVAKAKDYLEYSSFSKQGLIDQLVFDDFTQAQATFGANKAY